MHIGPTPTHRLREEITRELFDDGDSPDTADDTDETVRRPHDERARARQRVRDTLDERETADTDPETAAWSDEPTGAPDDTEASDEPTGAPDATGPTDDRPLAERATDSVFESEPATDVALLDDET